MWTLKHNATFLHLPVSEGEHVSLQEVPAIGQAEQAVGAHMNRHEIVVGLVS